MTKGLDAILEGQGDQPGGSAEIFFPPRVGNAFDLQNSSTIARVFGDKGDAQSWVVTLGVIEGPNAYQLLPTRGSPIDNGERAVLNWGLDAAAFTAELDWRPCSFVVHGAYVEVSARSPIVTLGQSYRYKAAIVPAEGTAVQSVKPGGPTRTINSGSIGPASSVTIVVPMRARGVRFFNTFGSPQVSVNVNQLETVGGTIVAICGPIATNGGELTGLSLAEWLPLVWCCRALTILNPSAVNTTSVSAEFLIDVG